MCADKRPRPAHRITSTRPGPCCKATSGPRRALWSGRDLVRRWQEGRGGADGDQAEPVHGPRAGHVEQAAVHHAGEHRLAGIGDDHAVEFQTLGQMRRADDDAARKPRAVRACGSAPSRNPTWLAIKYLKIGGYARSRGGRHSAPVATLGEGVSTFFIRNLHRVAAWFRFSADPQLVEVSGSTSRCGGAGAPVFQADGLIGASARRFVTPGRGSGGAAG